MAELVKLMIDGREVEVAPGTLIIEAAKKLNIEIPTFCYDERLRSVGACRMCLVEVEKSPKLVASCATPVAPGMVVKTNTQRVVDARRAVLEFLLINHPLDCPTCDKGGECPLQNLTYKYGPPTSRFTEDKIRFQEGTSLKFDDLRIGPEIWLNRNRCIICFKCVRIARELAGGDDLGMFNRGAYAMIDIPTGIKYANEFSGNTVEYCPVGALMSDSFRYKIRTWYLDRKPSVCWLCSDGCNITVESNNGKIYRHQSRRNDRIDRGFLCDRGRYGFDIPNHHDRLRFPATVRNGIPEIIGYDEALAMAIHRLREQDSQSAALLLDTSITNEDAFSAAEFFREKFPDSLIAVASKHDIPFTVSPSTLGLSVSMQEMENADLVILIDCDLSVEHPILGLRIKKLIASGKKLYSIHHRPVSLGRFQFTSIQARYGHEHEEVDYITKCFLEGKSSEGKGAEHEALLLDIGRATNIHILVGSAFFDNPNRYLLSKKISNLAASIKARVSYLTDETNFIGVQLSARPNASFEQIVTSLAQGKIKTLFVAGGDPVEIYPDREVIISALRKAEYVIYWGAFDGATAQFSTLIFPRAFPAESAGSFLNIERRLQFLTRAYVPPKEINSLHRLLTEFKIELGGKLYYSEAEVFAEMTRKISEFSSFAYGASEGELLPHDGNPEFPSTPEINIEANKEFPFVLSFAESFYYGVSGLTIYSETLNKLNPDALVLINPDDAKKYGIDDRAKVLIISKNGKAEFIAKFEPKINTGELVLSGHSPNYPPNSLMKGWNKPVYAAISLAKVSND